MTLIEAAEKALEALELALRCHGVMLLSDPPKDAWKYHGVEADANKAITALRTAIAEAEKQEPVAWMMVNPEHLLQSRSLHWEPKTEWHISWQAVPLYTTPPAQPAQRQWVGLTDAQIEQVYFEVAKKHRGTPMPWGQVQFGKALEAKLKEKNT